MSQSPGCERLQQSEASARRLIAAPKSAALSQTQGARLVNGSVRVAQGIFRRINGKLVLLAGNMGAEVSFWKDQVEEKSTWFASIMPEGFGDSLPADGLIDLLGYLLQQASP